MIKGRICVCTRYVLKKYHVPLRTPQSTLTGHPMTPNTPSPALPVPYPGVLERRLARPGPVPDNLLAPGGGLGAGGESSTCESSTSNASIVPRDRLGPADGVAEVDDDPEGSIVKICSTVR